MPARQFEHRGDLPLRLPLAHQRGVAARAQGERERIEQDRFAGAGLAGQHGKALGEIEIELVDQDDVPDGKARQHADRLPVPVWRVGRSIPEQNGNGKWQAELCG